MTKLRGALTAPKRRTTMESYDNLRRLVESVDEDINKAKGGNKAAGTRVRKVMQEIKAAAQEIRAQMLEIRSEDN